MRSYRSGDRLDSSNGQPSPTHTPPGAPPTSSSLLGAALAYCDLGWSVIPLCHPRHEGPHPGHNKQRCTHPGKAPAVAWKQFSERRATREEIIRWWVVNPGFNVGVVLGQVSGLVAVDVDGPDGEAELLRICPPDQLTTLRFKTHKGYRLLFRIPQGWEIPRRWVRVDGAPLDFLGSGCYTVMPPSVHAEGTVYEWNPGGPAEGEPVAELPAPVALHWAAGKRRAPRGKTGTTRLGCQGGAAEDVENARRYLRECEPAIFRQGGRERTFKLACKMVHDFNLSVDTALSVMMNEWNERCDPPWEEDELRREVEGAAERGGPSETSGSLRRRGRDAEASAEASAGELVPAEAIASELPAEELAGRAAAPGGPDEALEGAGYPRGSVSGSDADDGAGLGRLINLRMPDLHAWMARHFAGAGELEETPPAPAEPAQAVQDDAGPAGTGEGNAGLGGEGRNRRHHAGDRPPLPTRRRGRVASEIAPLGTEWFWEPWVPRAMLSALVGLPGSGKSTLVASLISRAKRSILLAGYEEDVERVTVPRLIDNKVDRESVLILQPRDCRFPDDADWLLSKALEWGAELICLDPIDSFMGDGLSPDSQPDVRRFLESLAKVAGESGAAVVAVRHPGKDPTNTMPGSRANREVYRVITELVYHPGPPAVRIIRHHKPGLTEPDHGRRYELSATAGKHRTFVVGEPVSPRAADLARPDRDPAEAPQREAAVESLRLLLAEGEVEKKEVMKRMEEERFSRSTVYRAAEELGVLRRLDGSGKNYRSLWRLPT
jgi:hypothetical protein